MTRPPRLLASLARLLVRGRNREFLLGDLDELYTARAARHGKAFAALWYVVDVLGSSRLGRSNRSTEGTPSPLGPGRPTLPDIGTELLQSIRGLLRRPAFTLLLVATLALGLGPTVVVVSLVDQMLMQPLPGAANSREAAYLAFFPLGEELRDEGLTHHEFDDLRSRASLLQGVATYGTTTQHVTVDGGRPIRVGANVVYGDFFDVLGVRAAEGRLLSSRDTGLNADPLVAVISEDLRDRLFGVDEPVVGRSMQMNRQPVEVVGVAAGGFRGPVRNFAYDAWLPYGSLIPLAGFTQEILESPNSTMHSRLLVLPRDDASVETIESQLSEILSTTEAAAGPDRAAELAELRPQVDAGLHAAPSVRDRARWALSAMGWAAALLLAIACANVANLLLFQNLARRGSLATRRALGASTARLARQHLMQSAILAGLGGVAGLGIGWLIARAFKGQLLLSMPEFEGVALDTNLIVGIAFTVGLTLVLFGVVPAVLAGRFDLGAALRSAGAGDSGRLGFLRTGLSAVQLSLTLALLVGGMLMLRTIMNLDSLDTGVDVDRVIRATVDLPGDLDPEASYRLRRSVLDAVVAEPSVEAAALDLYGPHASELRMRVRALDDPDTAPGEGDPILTWQVSPGWFELFGLESVTGRTFSDADWSYPSTGAAVLTASLAQRLFGTTDVVGRSIEVRRATPEERQVVGVVENYISYISIGAQTSEESLRPSGPTDAVFIPHGEVPLFQMTVLAKPAVGAGDVPARLTGVLEAYFTDVPSPTPYLVSERVERIHREERLLSRLLLVLSACGALMSGVGLFAAIYFVVMSRRQEFGIRVALGADAPQIVRHVAMMAATTIIVGIGIGLAAAYPLSQALRARLFGVQPLDGVSYATAVGVLAAVALLAFLGPAREALTADPVAIMKQE